MGNTAKVTMIVEIKSMTRKSKKNRKGNDMTGLEVTGDKLIKGGVREDFSRWLNDYFDADAIAAFEQIGIGGKAVVVMEKPEDGYWNITSVKPASGGSNTAQDSGGTTTSAPNANVPATTDSVTMPAVYQPPVEVAAMDQRRFAIYYGCKLMIAMLENGVVKAAKASPELLMEGVVSLADDIQAYLKGDVNSEPEADASDLDGDNGDIPEDDIPF